jgi:hypothetical protein
MAGMAAKLCLIDADTAVKRDILECSEEVRREIGEFLERLQCDPLLPERKEKNESTFYVQLPCGVFVVWEIVGDLLHLVLHGADDTILVRIVGVVWESPTAP